MIKKWEISDEQQRKKCVQELLRRIEEQGEAGFGILAAEDIIDITSQYIGPESYNKGIEEARKAIQTNISDLDVQLDLLRENI